VNSDVESVLKSFMHKSESKSRAGVHLAVIAAGSGGGALPGEYDVRTAVIGRQKRDPVAQLGEHRGGGSELASRRVQFRTKRVVGAGDAVRSSRSRLQLPGDDAPNGSATIARGSVGCSCRRSGGQAAA